MYRLNKRAFEILKAEVMKLGDDLATQVSRDIALRRWERLCQQSGTPVTLEELRETISDLFPNFSEMVLKQAARANRSTGTWKRVKFATIALLSTVGGVWVLNLPYPPIRLPVARVLPIVLLPSFISMDSNYRTAIASTEQADQLVNQATSPADLELGETKVKTAQKSLDALPVWFLGYYPQFYCGWFQCGWRFTLDEFQQARKQVARMEARLFQEKNAQTQLVEANQAINQAKQKYQSAVDETERGAAIDQWQRGIDAMRQIPSTTLAGRMVLPQLDADQRDFQKVAGIAAGSALSSNLIQAAREFAGTAQQSQKAKATHTAEEWQEIENLWQESIDRLKQIDAKDPDYLPAQKLLASYQTSLGNVRIRLQQEQEATRAYGQAISLRANLYASVPDNAKFLTPAQAGMLQQIVVELEKVKPGTTVYGEAQTMQKAAQARLR